MTINIIDPRTDFNVACDKLQVVHSQEIPIEAVREWRRKNTESMTRRCQEVEHVAAIPVLFAHEWMRRDGFDVYDKNVSLRDIIAKIKKEDCHAFLTSGKQF